MLGPTDLPAPAGPPAFPNQATAKVYWPDGTTTEHVNRENATWTTFDWADMLYPEFLGFEKFDADLSSYAAVLHNIDNDDSQLYNIDEWVVLVDDQAKRLYHQWLKEGRAEEECPWRTNVFAWNVHGPVIVIPRSSFP